MTLSRRKFLLGGASLAAMVANSPAESFFHRSVVAAPPPALGVVQVGVPNPDVSAFKNLTANLGSFQASGGTYAYPSVLNVDGYPTGTITTTLFGTFPIPSNITSATTMVMAWTGTISNGASAAMQMAASSPGITVTVGAGFVIGSTTLGLNVAGTNGYIEWNWTGTPPTGNTTLNFFGGANFGSGATQFSNFIICAKSDYASIIAATNAGQLLSTNYINTFKALNPHTIRTMAWTNPNQGNNFTQHRYRKNWQTNIGYGTPTWIPNCWAGGPGTSGPNCNRNVTTNDYTCAAATDTPAAYTMGEVIQFQIDLANNGTGSMTLNVGGRGAVPVFANNAGSVGSFAANALCTAIYDDLLGGYLLSGGGLSANIPVEVQVGLANQVGCNLWYTFPPHITYKNSTMEPTNSVVQIATLLANTVTVGVNVEYANEMWNFNDPLTIWAEFCGAKLGFPNSPPRNFDSFYALRVAQIAPQVASAWSAVRSGNLKYVIAYQAVAGTTNNSFRLNGTDLATGLWSGSYDTYVGQNFNTSPNRPVDVADTLSYAVYWMGAQCQDLDAHYAPSTPGTSITITAVSQANPGVLSYASDPGYTTGDRVQLRGAGFSGGMTQLNNVNVSLTRLTATTYSIFTDATLATGIDTTSFTPYTSGGASGRYPQISGLTSWATTFGSNPTSAIASLQGDIASGTNNGSLGGATLLNFLSAANLGLGAIGIYPTWESVAAGYDASRPAGKVALTVEPYEAAMQCLAPSTTACTTLGISTSFGGTAGSIQALINGYKNSTNFFNDVTTQLNNFFASPHSKVGCWFIMTGNSTNQWSMFPGDIYATPWQSYAAVEAYP